jgi:hypothetical protein
MQKQHLLAWTFLNSVHMRQFLSYTNSATHFDWPY